MADSVSVAATPGASYVWSTTGITWASAESGKLWGSLAMASYSLTANESLSVADSGAKQITKPRSESFSATDAHYKSVAKASSESVSVTEKRAFSGAKNLSDSIALTEKAGKVALKPFAEAFSVTDKAKRLAVKSVMETLGLAESYLDNINFIINVMENIGVGEQFAKSFSHPIAETFGISEKAVRQFGKALAESTHMSELLAKTQKLSAKESVAVAELSRKTTEKKLTESARVAEAGFKKTIALAVHEIVGVMELLGRAVGYHIAISESVTVRDAIRKNSRLTIGESLAIFDEYRRNANAIISDMIVSTEPLTMAAFMQVVDAGRAPGFAPFRDFIPGDYEYQTAIFRAVLKSATTDRAKLKEMKVTVDVPDVFDRGSITITADQATDGVRINFTRSFHIIPEITVTLKGGTVIAHPRVLNPDDGGFTLVLETPSGTRVGGTVSWQAQGY